MIIIKATEPNESLLVHLNCFSLHMYWISPSSSGSPHFRSTVVQSTTSAFKNKALASLYSQSSGGGCFCMKEKKDINNEKRELIH